MSEIRLRHWMESDARCLYHFAKNPNVGPIAGWPPHESVEYSLNIIKTLFCRPECYAIVKDDVPIGCAELLIHPDGNHWWGEGSAELGYWVAEEYQGNGYATQACIILIKRAFEDLNIQRIFASYKKENLASKRVLEKLGFEYFTELNNIDYTNRVFREIAMILEK
ncbi:GNAT family N-acetyltransferase [uncultured Methanobrevibacter sp.]|uniref:GNAT family N-acetyltransferase n=1 Tax=uncultured Methanobrevibacter sp. TaxID=253161 RepID=UPI0025EF317C|nr:GNAT family N-acetyltransferase [uncultured Methanobrevibacter sp.]MDO5809955.1 GNAT family N-acetyltransferase [Methanobrevibacter sp.]